MLLIDAGDVRWVFSAYAEVVPQSVHKTDQLRRILRVRGGSSNITRQGVILIMYSPRTRR